MHLPLYFNEDVFDDLRLPQRKWRLDLAPHQTFELSRAVEAAYRALVDENSLTVGEEPEIEVALV